MSHIPHGALIAVHASQKKKQRIEKEEEEMTKYTTEDLENNWEFKIVRATYPAFRKPDVFQSLLEEEAVAGWELVEKLDDQRIRFKRKKDTRRNDYSLPQGYDPYRTTYGANTNMIGVMISLVLVLLIAGIILFLGMDQQAASRDIPWIAITTAIPAVLIIVGMIVVIYIRTRQG